MLRIKGCLRCHGDLLLETDAWGAYWMCLQCSHIVYPRVSERHPLLAFESIPRPIATGFTHGLQALVVGEDMDSCSALAAHLERLGLQPTVAISWDEAWQLLAGTHYGVVFIDTDEVGVTALASAKRIKRAWSETRVVITVYRDGVDEDVLLKSADLVVHKPLTAAELEQAVETALGSALRVASVA